MKDRKTLIIIGAIAALLLLGCCCAAAGLFLLRDGGGASGSYKLTSEQQAVVDDFGMPDDFSVLFGQIAEEQFADDGTQPTHRVEYWNYRDPRIAVIFRDGRFVRQETLEPLPEGTWAYPRLDPSQISQGMTAEEIAKLVDATPDEGGRTDPSTGVDLITISFGRQVVASFEDGVLAMLTTLPVKTSGK